MEKLEFPRVGEQMYHQVLDNGLHIFVVPKPGFQKSYAFFATNYGGMDMKFKLDGQDMDTPAGVAHYLEHKMFDTKEGNALQELAANGAQRNSRRTCASCSPSSPFPISPRRAWTRSRGSSVRRSA